MLFTVSFYLQSMDVSYFSRHVFLFTVKYLLNTIHGRFDYILKKSRDILIFIKQNTMSGPQLITKRKYRNDILCEMRGMIVICMWCQIYFNRILKYF